MSTLQRLKASRCQQSSSLTTKPESKQMTLMEQTGYKEYCIGNGGPIVVADVEELSDDFVDTERPEERRYRILENDYSFKSA